MATAHRCAVAKLGILIAGLAVICPSNAIAEQVIQLDLVGRESYQSLETVGRLLTTSRHNDRLAVFDHENHRILLYDVLSGFAAATHVRTLGGMLMSSEDAPYDASTNPRFAGGFRGQFIEDELYVTNPHHAQVLVFDREGNWLRTIPGEFAWIDAMEQGVFAFQADGIYELSPGGDSFDPIGNLPWGSAHRLGNYDMSLALSEPSDDRIAIVGDRSAAGQTIRMYRWSDVLNEPSPAPLFEYQNPEEWGSIPALAFLPGQLVWLPDYGSEYHSCDLEGNRLDELATAESFAGYVTALHEGGGKLDVVSAGPLSTWEANASDELVQIDLLVRESFYWDGWFCGYDGQNLYFRDHADGGIVIAQIDWNSGLAPWDPTDAEAELPFEGYLNELREYEGRIVVRAVRYFEDDWNPILYFYDEFGSRTDVPLSQANGMAVDASGVYVLSAREVLLFDHTGSAQGTIVLSGHEATDLFTLGEADPLNREDDQAAIAVDAQAYYVWYDHYVYVFDRAGAYQGSHDAPLRRDQYIFGDNVGGYAWVVGNMLALNDPVAAYMLPSFDFVDDDLAARYGPRGLLSGRRYAWEIGPHQYVTDSLEVTGLVSAMTLTVRRVDRSVELRWPRAGSGATVRVVARAAGTERVLQGQSLGMEVVAWDHPEVRNRDGSVDYGLEMSTDGSEWLQMANERVFFADWLGLSLDASPTVMSAATRIRFRVPRGEHARVDIVDVRGRRVVTLHSGRSAGEPMAIEWSGLDSSGRALAAGIYFVNLSTPGGSISRKLTVLR